MKQFAVIEQGIVKNLFVADEARVLELLFPEALVVEETEETGIVYIGGTYKDGVFVEPQPTEPVVVEETPTE
jgi:hypothetical protein